MNTGVFSPQDKTTKWAYRLPDLTRRQASEIVFDLLSRKEGDFTAYFQGEDHDIELYITSSFDRHRLDEEMLAAVKKVLKPAAKQILLLGGPHTEPGVS